MIEFAGNTINSTAGGAGIYPIGNFYIASDGKGNTRYHWQDTEIGGLSSMKLWDILRQTVPRQGEMHRRFVTAINHELSLRGELPPPDVARLFQRPASQAGAEAGR